MSQVELEKRLRLPEAQAESRREGVAAALLVDTSGSMNEEVPDSEGRQRDKLDIAKRCVMEVVERFEAFAQGHPDKNVQLGIYDFSVRRDDDMCRRVAPMGKPDLELVEPAVKRLHAQGNTPIGEAMIVARQDLNAAGMNRTHILVITDGESNRGTPPDLVARAIMNLPEEQRSSIYFVAFDVAAQRFDTIRDAGGLVMAASSGQELSQALDYLLTGKILAEQPEVPAAK